MRAHRVSLLALSLLVSPVFAVTKGGMLDLPPIRPLPRIVFHVPEARQAIQIKSRVVSREVLGHFVHTKIEYTFYNPNARILEGELQFPLLEGQSITGFSLDIEGELRPAVAVEKAQGQEIFEEVIRGRIDPALLEKTQGHAYKLRVYPLPAQGSRRAVLELTETVQPTPKAAAKWHAPIIQTGVFKNQGYFYAEIPAPSQTGLRPTPKKIALMWDASGSGAQRNHPKEWALLEAYFKALQSVEVTLIVARNEAETPQTFQIEHGNWAALREVLEKVAYDGATTRKAFTPPVGVDLTLLFSDGVFNDAEEVIAFEKTAPIFTFSASAGSNASTLKPIAVATGGAWVDLLKSTPTAALAMLQKRPAQLKRVSGQAVQAVVTNGQTPEQGYWQVAGEMTESKGSLELELEHSDGTRATRHYPLLASTQRGAVSGERVAQRWADLQLATLEENPEANQAAIVRLGKHFSKVTSETSLLVLDRVQDYVRYEITPPASLQAAYSEQLAFKQKSMQDEQTAHLEKVRQQWTDYVAWWKKEFPQGKPPAPKKESSSFFGGFAAAMPAPVAMMERMPTMTKSAAPVRPLAAPPAPPAKVPSSVEAAPAPSSAQIQLKKATPDAPYLKRLQETPPEKRYAVYLDERPTYANSSAFFLDVADFFFEQGEPRLAHRVLSNLREMNLENRALLRILGYRLLQAKRPDLAIPILKKVKKLSPNEPQSWRDLALAYQAADQPQPALAHFWEVVRRPWHNRFPDIELTALTEMNALIARHAGLDTSKIEPGLIESLPLALRVVLAWDADNSDMDLWVTDPNGEKAYYGNRLTYQGGRMSRDFTGGYGPETFSLRKAKSGMYKVEAQFYGHRQQVVAGATTLMLNLTTDFGLPQQKQESIILRLKGDREVVQVGTFEVK